MTSNQTDLGTHHAITNYKQLVMERVLRACALFSGLPGKEFDALLSIAWLKSLNKGEHVFYEANANFGAYIVQSGAIRLYRMNGKGHEQTVRIARFPESFAEESLFSESGHALNAAAIQPSRLVVLPRNEFLRLLRSSPELLFRVVRVLSGRFVEVVGLVDDLRLKSTRTRLAKWILEHCPKPSRDEPPTITLSLPKRVLASELGMASETFSRALAQFQHEHLLAVQGRTLVLLRPRSLERVLTEEADGMECEGRLAMAT